MAPPGTRNPSTATASTSSPIPTGNGRSKVTLTGAVIRFAGDSGDGMQLTGDRFTSQTAVAGNDLATLPDYPAEIRAPAGTLAGVSSFQLHFSDEDIHTPGDAPGRAGRDEPGRADEAPRRRSRTAAR